jgi:hypothetical protein
MGGTAALGGQGEGEQGDGGAVVGASTPTRHLAVRDGERDAGYARRQDGPEQVVRLAVGA